MKDIKDRLPATYDHDLLTRVEALEKNHQKIKKVAEEIVFRQKKTNHLLEEVLVRLLTQDR